MAQEFYVDNLTSRFIKCLLWDTYIPIVQVWKPNGDLIKGMTYVTQNKHIVVAQDDYTWTSNNPLENDLDSKYFKIIDNYIEGKFYRGITSNFESNSALYDPSTHYALGQYLRYIRDMHNLDLMPFYNCFSGISSDKIRINSDGTINNYNKIDDGLISYIVPIKFNQEYTIYYNSDVPFYITPIYYDSILATNAKNLNGTIMDKTKISRCSFDNPYKFNGVTFNGNDLAQMTTNQLLLTDYFALLVQVPKKKFANLLVLEGDYTKVKLNHNNQDDMASINKLPQVFIGEQIGEHILSDIELDDIFKPYSSLINNISSSAYAFSDRLIEYLLYSPIVKNDRIRFNIKRVQEDAEADGNKEIYVPDIWSTQLRYFLYDYVTQHSKTPLYKDINGYVDKDTEFLIDNPNINEENWNV